MYEHAESQGRERPDPHVTGSSVDAIFATLLDGLFTGSRDQVTYPPVTESPVYDAGHRPVPRRRRFVLRAGADLDDPN